MKFLGFKESLNKSSHNVTLYRGIAGLYKYGRNDIQHFSADISSALHYAKKEAKYRKLDPNVYSIEVDSETISKYRTVGGVEEIYDIPSQVVDAIKPKLIPIDRAERMANSYQTSIDLSDKKILPVIFKSQGPENNGWYVKVSPMGDPFTIKKVLAREIRDVVSGAIRNDTLLQRMRHLDEVPVMIVSNKEAFITTLPKPAKEVLAKQVG